MINKLTAYEVLNKDYPTKWPAELTSRIALRIGSLVREGNIELAASVAAQTAADFYFNNFPQEPSEAALEAAYWKLEETHGDDATKEMLRELLRAAYAKEFNLL